MLMEQVTFVLLYFALAGIIRVDMIPAFILFISGVLSSGNVDPLTNQVIEPLLALQVKVAVDPSVVLTDLGVLMKAEI